MDRIAYRLRILANSISFNAMTSPASIQYLTRPEGRVAYTVTGSGPLVVAVPGMGDLRSSYRELVEPLVQAGFRVAVTDLRGHGDSDTAFQAHGDIATAGDLLALIDHLNELEQAGTGHKTGGAIVLGNSMGAAAAEWATAERPDAIRALVFFGPILRDPETTPAKAAAMKLALRLMLTRPWGAGAWANFYRSLNTGVQAPWLGQHVADIRANLQQPGKLRSFRQLALQLSHAEVEPRIREVHVPTLAFLGELDPDYADPIAEAEWLRGHGLSVVMVPDAGHYPHAQRPELVVTPTLEFLHALPALEQHGGKNA